MKQYFQTYKDFLNESAKTAKERFLYTNKITPMEFEELLKIDPTPTKKYIDKLCAWYLEGISVEELSNSLDYYVSLINMKKVGSSYSDINAFPNYTKFSEFLKSFGEERLVSNTSSKKSITKNVDVVFEDSKFTIIRPKTIEEERIYGFGTNWCISKEDKWEEHYVINKTEFYIVINKELPEYSSLHKIIVSVMPYGLISVSNSLDKVIDTKILDEWGLDKTMFKPREGLTVFERYYIDESLIRIESGRTIYGGTISLDRMNLTELPNFYLDAVEGNYYCRYNEITNTDNIPTSIKGNCDFSYNNNLVDLSGVSHIGGNLNCSFTPLQELSGKMRVDGDLVLLGVKNFTEEDVASSDIFVANRIIFEY